MEPRLCLAWTVVLHVLQFLPVATAKYLPLATTWIFKITVVTDPVNCDGESFKFQILIFDIRCLKC